MTEAQLKAHFAEQFERSVKDIMQDLSKAEQESLSNTFSKRKLNLDVAKGTSIHDAATFYEALPEKLKEVLSKKAVEGAFESIKKETREKFFKSLESTSSISYLDLPLKAALVIHQNLRGDPWL
jgi:hypothetical protein